ncbi:DUF6512 family protein [Halovulum sp. GXIMD14794]
MTPTFGRLLRVEMLGACLMIALGSALHFAFDWIGGWRPLAVVAAVNESVWEHLKLAFWPGVLWALVAPLAAGQERSRVLAAKGVTLLVTGVLIVMVFTSYTAILGRNLLPLDIGTFVAAIVAGQLLSVSLLSSGVLQSQALRRAGLVLLTLQLVAYSLFTYYPPKHWLFIETRTQIRGIPAEESVGAKDPVPRESNT